MRISEIPNIGLDNSRSARAPDKRGTPPGNGVMGEDRVHKGSGDQLGVLSNDLNMIGIAAEGVVARPDITAGMDKTDLYPVRPDNVRFSGNSESKHAW
jgi:hypothetical protein